MRCLLTHYIHKNQRSLKDPHLITHDTLEILVQDATGLRSEWRLGIAVLVVRAAWHTTEQQFRILHEKEFEYLDVDIQIDRIKARGPQQNTRRNDYGKSAFRNLKTNSAES